MGSFPRRLGCCLCVGRHNQLLDVYWIDEKYRESERDLDICTCWWWLEWVVVMFVYFVKSPTTKWRRGGARRKHTAAQQQTRRLFFKWNCVWICEWMCDRRVLVQVIFGGAAAAVSINNNKTSAKTSSSHHLTSFHGPTSINRFRSPPLLFCSSAHFVIFSFAFVPSQFIIPIVGIFIAISRL